MAEQSSIEWTDATWNPVTGCSVVSPGCTNCYAMRLAGTRLKHHPSRAGLTIDTKAGPVWNGQVRFNAEWLTQPLRWKRPRRIFVCAHGDLFHEDVPDEWIDKVFAVMALAPQHTFQVLTKRAARMREYLSDPELRARLVDANWPIAEAHWKGTPQSTFAHMAAGHRLAHAWPLPNVWLGVSAEDQPRADERVPDLIFTPAAVRYVSVEPMIAPVDLTNLPAPRVTPDDEVMNWRFNALFAGDYYWFVDGLGYSEGGDGPDRPALDWVIVGGENGPRPMHPDWVRKIRDDCAEADATAFFFKQWGSHKPNATARVSEAGGNCPPFVAWPDGSIAHGTAEEHGGLGQPLNHVGKKAAGRLLDGVEHNAMPGAAR
jgi:protein gp37